jgi:hypothetical protein
MAAEQNLFIKKETSSQYYKITTPTPKTYPNRRTNFTPRPAAMARSLEASNNKGLSALILGMRGWSSGGGIERKEEEEFTEYTLHKISTKSKPPHP